MTYCPPQEALIVYGGRNNEGTTDMCYDDMWAFCLDLLVWQQIDLRKGPGARYLHGTCYLEDDVIIIFGGLKTHSVCDSKVHFIDLSQSVVRAKLKRDEKEEYQ